jgi:hypothetical protein
MAAQLVSVRQATWLLLKDRTDLDPSDQAYMEVLCKRCPEADHMRSLAQVFGGLMRARDHASLKPGLSRPSGAKWPSCVALRPGCAAIGQPSKQRCVCHGATAKRKGRSPSSSSSSAACTVAAASNCSNVVWSWQPDSLKRTILWTATTALPFILEAVKESSMAKRMIGTWEIVSSADFDDEYLHY